MHCWMPLRFDSVQVNIKSELNTVFLLGCPVLNVKHLYSVPVVGKKYVKYVNVLEEDSCQCSRHV